MECVALTVNSQNKVRNLIFAPEFFALLCLPTYSFLQKSCNLQIETLFLFCSCSHKSFNADVFPSYRSVYSKCTFYRKVHSTILCGGLKRFEIVDELIDLMYLRSRCKIITLKNVRRWQKWMQNSAMNSGWEIAQYRACASTALKILLFLNYIYVQC